MSDLAAVIAIAAACSGGVGVLAVLAAPLLRRRTLRQVFAAVAAVAVLAFVAGVVGTARAMFLSAHDFRVTLVVSATAGLVSLGVALLLARHVQRGSEVLRVAARELGDHGKYRAASFPATAELAALSAELEDASRKLEEVRRRERALDTSRRELVAWVSHDLRSPLAGMRAMAEALEDGVAPDPERYHKQIRVEVDRLNQMVDDLFELACIQAGALRLNKEPLSLSDVVSDTIAATDPLARAKDVQLSGHAAQPLTDVHGDVAELSRAVTNLVVNAIRHTPSGGTVVVDAAAHNGGASLRVTDSCGGLTTDELERLFDPARRGNGRTPSADRGAGLGLAIVRGIVEAHGGTVDVRNVGTGCRFELVLPGHTAD